MGNKENVFPDSKRVPDKSKKPTASSRPFYFLADGLAADTTYKASPFTLRGAAQSSAGNS